METTRADDVAGTLLLDPAAYLGPARVLEAAAGRVRLALPERQEAWAVTACAYPYRPAPGDTVLAIGQEGNYYVIGVIQGTGATAFTAPGDIELRAPKGRIDLLASQGVRIRSAEVCVRTGRLEIAAKSLFETFGNAWRRVRETLQVRAGRARTITEGDCTLRSGGRIVERAKKDVRIDGKQINLG